MSALSRWLLLHTWPVLGLAVLLLCAGVVYIVVKIGTDETDFLP